MAELNLEWIEAGRLNTKKIVSPLPEQQPEALRIGRDPTRCDVVLTDGSVSGLHVELGFDLGNSHFYVQNLRQSNPPIVNGEPVVSGRVPLQAENTIQLGNVQLRAIIMSPVNPLPATDVQVPVPGVPPTVVMPSGSPIQPPPIDIPPSSPPLESGSSQGAYHYAGVQASSPEDTTTGGSSKAVGFILAGVAVMLGLFALAWPNISGFLGIGRSRVVSESSESTVPSDDSSTETSTDETLSMSELEPYVHPSGLFALEIPRNWAFLDNSQPGDIVIQGWHHPQLNAYVIVRIFDTDRQFTQSQLQNFAVNTVEQLFGELDGFRRGDPEIRRNRNVQVGWDAQDGPDTLLASTIARQDGLHLTALTVWIPDGVANFAELEEEIQLIVSSYTVDPEVPIP